MHGTRYGKSPYGPQQVQGTGPFDPAERYMARAHFQEFKTTAEYKALEMRRGLVELAVEKVHGVVGDGYIQSALSPTATGSMLGAAPPPNGLNDGGGGGGGGRPKSSKRRSQAL